jgi:hypothetical protein
MRCGTFTNFHVDRVLDGKLTLKSMEHGHTINAPERLSKAVRAAGLLAEPTT